MANYPHVGPYLPTRRLAGEHGDSIISLAFSAKGRYLASGSDDSTLVIWDVEDGNKLSSFRLDSRALSLVWDSHREDRLFVGCVDGTAAFIDKFQGAFVPILTGLHQTPVYALAVDPFAQPCRIGIGAGPQVHIATAISEFPHYATNSILPRPSTLPRGRVEGEDADDDRVRARSLHFTNRGRNLVVSYLNHGIVCWDVATSAQLWCIEPSHTHRHINASGFSAISPDEKEIAISNLSTGVDVYSLKSMTKTRSFIDTILPDTNYPIGVEFLANGSLVSSGSHTGRPCVWDKHSCGIFQVLEHGRELICGIQQEYLNSRISQCLRSLFDALQ
ncbi:WD40-repeat-containing domain protein [Amanita rubescens]|nr:WD40-repeat-containing domain protein [Amanita rubescens]